MTKTTKQSKQSNIYPYSLSRILKFLNTPNILPVSSSDLQHHSKNPPPWLKLENMNCELLEGKLDARVPLSTFYKVTTEVTVGFMH